MTTPTLPLRLRSLIAESTRKHWWWDETASAFRGCTRVSPGCANCWCLEMIESRLRHQAHGAYTGHVGPTYVPHVLDEIARDRQPKRYFTPSMSDPFHEAYTDEVVLAFFDALRRADQHWYFVLTKRSERLASLGPHIAWSDHIMAVVSVEDERYLHRLDDLRACGAKRIGASFEPLIGRIPLTTPAERSVLRGLDFAIVGGETADEDKVRPMRPEWAREVVEACVDTGVPVFFKQWGDVNASGDYVGRKKAGRLLDGRTYDDLPRGCAEHLARASARID